MSELTKIKEFELPKGTTELEYKDRFLILLAKDADQSFLVAGYRRTGNYNNEEGREAVMVEIISDPVEQNAIRDVLLKDINPDQVIGERFSEFYPSLSDRKGILEEEIQKYKNKHVVFFY